MKILGYYKDKKKHIKKRQKKNRCHELDKMSDFFPFISESLNIESHEEEVLCKYDFPLLPQKEIFGVIRIFNDRMADIRLMHLYGDKEMIEGLHDTYQLDTSPFQIDRKELINTFFSEKGKRDQPYIVSLEKQITDQNVQHLIVKYYKWLYYKFVSKTDRDPSSIPALSAEDVEKLSHFL